MEIRDEAAQSREPAIETALRAIEELFVYQGAKLPRLSRTPYSGTSMMPPYN
jgi:hypothetical protein